MTDPHVVLLAVCVAATAASAVAVARTVTRTVRLLRSGRPDPARTGEPGRRTLAVLRQVLGHTRIARSPVVGAAHWFVMVGFCALVPNVALAYAEVLDPAADVPVIGGWGPYELLVEVMGVGTVVGIGVLVAVRQARHPRRGGRASRFAGSRMGQAYFVEAVVALEGLGVLAVRAAAHAAGTVELDPWTAPVSVAASHLLPAEPALVPLLAAAKILVAVTWLGVVAAAPTMGVAWHRFTAVFNLWFARHPDGRPALGPARPLTSGGRVLDLGTVDPDTDTLGVGAVEDLTWKGLLDLTSCTECGRCQELCPAWGTGKDLSPKALVTGLRDLALAPAARVTGEGTGDGGRPLVGPARAGAVLTEQALWACTTCGACTDACPVGIEHVDHVLDLRRHRMLALGQFPAHLTGTLRNLSARANPWGLPASQRTAWTEGLGFDVPVVTGSIGHDVEYLFWVGCAGALDDRARRTTRAVAELLHRAGVSWAVPGSREVCCGDPARRVGDEFAFHERAGAAVALLEEVFAGREAPLRRIVVTCPHCLNTVGGEFAQLGGHYQVVHHTELLARLVREGRLTPAPAPADERPTTYHDPCYLGRHHGTYSAPRELLAATGIGTVEMPRNRERSWCCGAGGGGMWAEDGRGTRIDTARAGQALATGATRVATACPFCRVVLDDAVRALPPPAAGCPGAGGTAAQVLDVAQLLLDSVRRGTDPVPDPAGPGTGRRRATPGATADGDPPDP